MSVVGSWRLDNPIAVREMRMRARGSRSYLLLFCYVLILSLVMLLAYGVRSQRPALYETIQSSGQELLAILFFCQACLIAVVTPGLTSWVLTIEHEQQTMELLVSTLLRPKEIVFGKLLPAILLLSLLLLSSFPLSMLCLVFGGVSPGEVVARYVGLYAYGIVLAAAGVLASSLFRKSFLAAIAAYLFAVAYSAIPNLTASLIASGWTGWLYSASPNPAWMGILPGWATGIFGPSDATTKILGVRVHAVVLTGVISGLLAWLLAAIATANIPNFNEDRAPRVRILFTLLTVCAFPALMTLRDPRTTGVTNGDVSKWFILVSSLAVLTAPQFSIAARIGRGSDLLSSLSQTLRSPKSWFHSQCAGGFWFSLVWAAVMCVICCIGATRSGRVADNLTQALQLTWVTLSQAAASAALGIMVYSFTRRVVFSRLVCFVSVAIFWSVTSSLVVTFLSPSQSKILAGSIISRALPLLPFVAWARDGGRLSAAAPSLSLAAIITNLAATLLFLFVAARALTRSQRESNSRGDLTGTEEPYASREAVVE
ncbi:MAG: ABC transporter permease [Armatimonadetes bacterium]|nr:ABC transporter permease [Armatimonadota bacterium]